MKTLKTFLEELIAEKVTSKEINLYNNPSMAEFNEINSAGGNCRGILTIKGNCVLASPKPGLIHQDIINYLISEGAIKSSGSWKNEVGDFIGIKQIGTTTNFQLADSYANDIVEKNKDRIEQIIAVAKNNKVGLTSKFTYKVEKSTASN